MSDDSNGIFSLPAGSIVAVGDTVLPSQHNPPLTQIATALSNRFSKDGRAPATGNWNLNTFRVLNVGDPTANGDATNKLYVDQQLTNVSNSITSNAEKISTKSANYTALLADKATSFRFTAAATLALTPAPTLLNNWWCEVWATNGNVIIDPDSAETINGAATLILQTGQAAKVFCTGTAFFAWVFSDSRTGPQLQGYSFGLGLSTNSMNALHAIDVGIGSAAETDSPYALMQLSTAITNKDVRSLWQVGSVTGGLDTGSVLANATYYIWLIQRSDTLVTDALFSLSATAPTMPANYDRKRLIGSVVRASSINDVPYPINTQGWVWSTWQPTTGLSSIDFTNIPTTARELCVVLDQVSLSGTDDILIQIGGATLETTGYDSQGSSNTTVSTSTSGFITRITSAAAYISGAVKLQSADASGLIWSSTGASFRRSDNSLSIGFTGNKTLPNALTRLSVTRTGTNTFDLGQVKLGYRRG